MTAIGIAGWLLVVGLAVAVARLRRRLELVAEAAHELRGPVAAFAYAVAWLRREPGGVRRALRFEAELARMRAGLSDLDAARAGRRAPARPETVALERLVNGAADGWRSRACGAERLLRQGFWRTFCRHHNVRPAHGPLRHAGRSGATADECGFVSGAEVVEGSAADLTQGTDRRRRVTTACPGVRACRCAAAC